MRRVLIGFALFLLSVVLLSAILSPLAYWLCDHFYPSTFPFRRVFNRVLMIGALAMLYPLARYWKVDSWQKLGIKDTLWWKHWLEGVSIGIITIAILFWILSCCGYSYSNIMSFQKFLQIILAAALVGLTEEILFRGMFFYALKDVLGKWIILWAVVISSFFAKTHFIKAEDLTSTVNWMSGWEMWRHVWPSWSQVPHIFMQYLNLFLMGLVLCALVWRMKSLWFAMGLHTGWVMIIQTIERNKNPLDEWQTMLFLIVMLAAILIKKHERLGAESR